MFDALLRVKGFMDEKLAALTAVCVAMNIQPFTASERKWLDEFVMVMGPLSSALDIIQGEKTVTAGNFSCFHFRGECMFMYYSTTFMTIAFKHNYF